MLNSLWKKELAVVIIGLFVTMSFNLPVSGHELMDNHRPEKPYFIGFDGGYEGETSWIKFNTTDLDGDDVYYFIEWGDETNSGWFGPYKSGEIVQANHTWENMGGYILKIRAKDIYDAVSLQELYYIQIKAHIEIRIHLGYGVGATVTVKNLGVKDYKHIPWHFNFNLKIDPHKSRLLKLKLGTLWSLKAGEERTFRECIFRFTLRGLVAFGLKFEALPYEYWLEDQCNCKIIGPFVYTYPLLYS